MPITPESLVQQNVLCCLSSLVSTLAGVGGMSQSAIDADQSAWELFNAAVDLASPVDDWEEGARGEGYEIRHDLHGFYWCDQDEARLEDDGANSVGFDGRPHFDSIDQAARECCAENDLEPYQREVFEHWAITDWLADKLEAHGEKVERDFAGLTVWARTTTGQAIYADGVIEAIAADLNASVEG